MKLLCQSSYTSMLEMMSIYIILTILVVILGVVFKLQRGPPNPSPPFPTLSQEVIEWRSVTSRYHGSTISGLQ